MSLSNKGNIVCVVHFFVYCRGCITIGLHFRLSLSLSLTVFIIFSVSISIQNTPILWWWWRQLERPRWWRWFLCFQNETFLPEMNIKWIVYMFVCVCVCVCVIYREKGFPTTPKPSYHSCQCCFLCYQSHYQYFPNGIDDGWWRGGHRSHLPKSIAPLRWGIQPSLSSFTQVFSFEQDFCGDIAASRSIA